MVENPAQIESQRKEPEHEVSFLVDLVAFPSLLTRVIGAHGKQSSVLEIEQHYLDDGLGTRIRQIRSGEVLSYESSVKEKILNEGKFEMITPIGAEVYQRLLGSNASNSVEKIRHTFELNGLELVVDVFGGRHSGYAIVEFDYPTKESMEGFDVSDFSWLKDLVDRNLAVNITGVISNRDITKIEGSQIPTLYMHKALKRMIHKIRKEIVKKIEGRFPDMNPIES